LWTAARAGGVTILGSKEVNAGRPNGLPRGTPPQNCKNRSKPANGIFTRRSLKLVSAGTCFYNPRLQETFEMYYIMPEKLSLGD
jgi:hypothetical protein